MGLLIRFRLNQSKLKLWPFFFCWYMYSSLCMNEWFFFFLVFNKSHSRIYQSFFRWSVIWGCWEFLLHVLAFWSFEGWYHEWLVLRMFFSPKFKLHCTCIWIKIFFIWPWLKSLYNIIAADFSWHIQNYNFAISVNMISMNFLTQRHGSFVESIGVMSLLY